MLSPLSWWNDLFVNVPLALAFAWVISCFYRGAFAGSFVLGYWLTNLLGLVLMQWGAETAFSDKFKQYGRRQIARDLVISLLYTALIVALVKLHVLAPLPDYFSHGH
jgi:cellulose synthase/poly-beta-1,6-N-acetylglucosamine synthase-like glycosyltransferase